MVALGYPGAKISLKEDVVPVEHRQRHGCQRLWSTSDRGELSARIQVMSTQGEFGSVNSDSIL